MYDIKYLMKFCGNLHGGLSKVAETLRVERIGPQHQAGSDSLLTSFTFLKLTESLFQVPAPAGSRLVCACLCAMRGCASFVIWKNCAFLPSAKWLLLRLLCSHAALQMSQWWRTKLGCSRGSAPCAGL